VTNDLDNLGLAPAANFTVETVEQVKTTTKELPSPSLVTNAVRPEVIVVEWREGRGSVTDKAARGVGIHTEQEGDKKVVSIPESLE
jgi:hypothetical protein